MEKDYLTCSCGLEAQTIYVTDKFGPVGFCGKDPAGFTPQEYQELLEAAQEDSPPQTQPGRVRATLCGDGAPV